MKKFLLFLFLSLLCYSASNAQPQPQDSTDIIWQAVADTFGTIRAIHISPDSKYVLTDCLGSANDEEYPNLQTIKFWDIKDGSLVQVFREEASTCFSKDGTILLTMKKDTIILRNSITMEIIKKIATGYSPGIDPFQFDISPDNKYVIYPVSSIGVYIFNLTTGIIDKKITDFPYLKDKWGQPIKYIYDAKYNPEGTQIYFCGYKTFVYDIAKDSIIFQYDGDNTKFSPDNIHFANIGFEGARTITKRWLAYYDSQTKQQITKIYPSGSYNYGHDFKFCFSPDGKYIITASSDGDGLVQIWDLNTSMEKYIYSLPISGHNFISSSKDGNFVSTCTSNRIYLLGQKYSTVYDKIPSIATISPNPATGIVNIDFILKKNETIYLTITDNIGKSISSINLGLLEVGNNSYIYNSSALSSGVYFLTLQSNTFSQTFKLVKE